MRDSSRSQIRKSGVANTNDSEPSPSAGSMCCRSVNSDIKAGEPDLIRCYGQFVYLYEKASE